jgi:hypothetical protein
MRHRHANDKPDRIKYWEGAQDIRCRDSGGANEDNSPPGQSTRCETVEFRFGSEDARWLTIGAHLGTSVGWEDFSWGRRAVGQGGHDGLRPS